MNYAVLASGSKGNCHAIVSEDHILLIDAGISLKQIKMRLTKIGWDPNQVKGIAISHEHSDHIFAIPALLRSTDWHLIATQKTIEEISKTKKIFIPKNRTVILKTGKITNWHNIQILPFSIPHDAVDPVAFRIESAKFSIAIVTDLGHQTDAIKKYCLNLNLLVIEANYDTQMLLNSSYPNKVKTRILSHNGHLSNRHMGSFLKSIANKDLNHVVLAHISHKNNNPLIAKLTAIKALAKYPKIEVNLAEQNKSISISLKNKAIFPLKHPI